MVGLHLECPWGLLCKVQVNPLDCAASPCAPSPRGATSQNHYTVCIPGLHTSMPKCYNVTGLGGDNLRSTSKSTKQWPGPVPLHMAHHKTDRARAIFKKSQTTNVLLKKKKKKKHYLKYSLLWHYMHANQKKKYTLCFHSDEYTFLHSILRSSESLSSSSCPLLFLMSIHPYIKQKHVIPYSRFKMLLL